MLGNSESKTQRNDHVASSVIRPLAVPLQIKFQLMRPASKAAAAVLISEQHAPGINAAFEQESISLVQRATQAREYLSDTADTGRARRQQNVQSELNGQGDPHKTGPTAGVEVGSVGRGK